MPVHLLMISAMSSSVTSSLSMRDPCMARLSSSSVTFSAFCSSMSVPYFSSAALRGGPGGSSQR